MVEDFGFELTVGFGSLFVDSINWDVLEKVSQHCKVSFSALRFFHHVDEFALHDRAGEKFLFADLSSAVGYTRITKDDPAAMVSVEQVHELKLSFAAGIVDRL